MLSRLIRHSMLAVLPLTAFVSGTSVHAEDAPPALMAQDLTGPTVIVPSKPKASALQFEPRRIAWPFDLPWGVAFLPDGRILVTERQGALRVIENGTLLTQPIAGIPEVISGGHAGLLDVLISRDFEISHRIYLSYTHGAPGEISMRVMSAELGESELTNQTVIFDSRPAQPGYDQIGGRLAYGPDGLLYLTLGDRTDKDRAQNLLDHSGTIVRFREDGSIPEDNPFVGRDDALPEIFTYGHRNPQGLVTSRDDGKLWSVEHGPYGGDELNLIEAGANYGWPLVTYGIDYDGTVISDKTTAPGITAPVYKWVPSVAPSSLASYTGDVMPEHWKGDFLLGTLSGERFIRLTMTDGSVTGEEQTLHHAIGRIRNVIAAPDGYVYLLTDGHSASLYRLEPLTEEMAGADAQ